jgi:hypothetical protein
MSGCLLAPFKLIAFIWHSFWKGVFWCFENGLKGFVVVGIAVIIFGIILGKSCGGSGPSVTVITTGIDLPNKISAPYYVEVNGDGYYTQSYHWQGSLLILDNYWYLKDGKWISGPAYAISGKIKVVTR